MRHLPFSVTSIDKKLVLIPLTLFIIWIFNLSRTGQLQYYFFRVLKGILHIIYRKTEIKGTENLPSEPCIIVANHCQLHGPVICEIFLPESTYTWCAAQMMHLKEVPGYAYSDFWSQKPRLLRPFFKVLSYIITPFSVAVFNNARTIPVRRDMRIISTFKKTISLLNEGKNIVIFPEHDKLHNNIVYDFQNNFIDIAKLYYSKTGKELSFVPMYIAPSLNLAVMGKPVKYTHDSDIKNERVRISHLLMDEISRLAYDLPVHTVIPYRNIPKKHYPKNTYNEVEKE